MLRTTHPAADHPPGLGILQTTNERHLGRQQQWEKRGGQRIRADM